MNEPMSRGWNREEERSLYNFLVRALGQKPLAKRVMRQLHEAGIPADLPQVVRSLTGLVAPEIRTPTLLGDPRHCLSRGPGEGAVIPRGLEDVALSPAHLLLFELHLVENRSFQEIAEVLGLTGDEVVTFMRDELHRLALEEGSAPVCRSGCADLRQLAGEALEARAVPAESPLPPCLACRPWRLRLRRLVTGLSHDSRLLSLSDRGYVEKALVGPKVTVDPDGSRRPPPTKDWSQSRRIRRTPSPENAAGPLPGPGAFAGILASLRALPGRRSAWAGAMLGGALVPLLFLATLESRPADLDTVSGMVIESADTPGATKAGAPPPVRATPLETPGGLPPGAPLECAGPEPRTWRTPAGTTVVLEPGGKAVALDSGVRLVTGRLKVTLAPAAPEDFTLEMGDRVGVTRRGSFLAELEGTQLSLRVEDGAMRVWDPDGRELRLGPGEELPGSVFPAPAVERVALSTSPR